MPLDVFRAAYFIQSLLLIFSSRYTSDRNLKPFDGFEV